MTTESKTCPQCGAPLPANAPGGLCPRCVMAMNMATQTEFTGDVGPHGTKVIRPVPSPEELAAKFPQLEILELLGRGGMGAVYKARQKELDRIVALKILPPGIGDDPAFAERFSREAKALAKLNHSNIVTLYEFGRADGLFFFLMEFVDGVNLRQLMSGDRISAREALAIVPQICDALQYAHDQGIVHRDIKPENILMDRRGRVKVADFGLAKLVGEQGRADLPDSREDEAAQQRRPAGDLTDAGKVMGTPQYMAPEQKERPSEVDHRADIYALGVVFYQMLTGELPGKSIEPPSKKVQIDVRLDEIVLRALEKNPERRYEQASVLKTQVETIAETADHPSDSPKSSGADFSVPPYASGYEYKSKRTWFGLPLLHVATGVDPRTGEARKARGIVALGGIATGWLAVGGRAYGGIAFGGIAVGGIAFGGLAIAPLAIGGLAIGYLAIGGQAFGFHLYDARQHDPETFPKFYREIQTRVFAIMGAIWVGSLGIYFVITKWARRQILKQHASAKNDPEVSETDAAKPEIKARRRRKVIWNILFAIAIAVILRTFVIRIYYATTDAVSPEVPRRSRVLVFKLARSFEPGDIIVYKLGNTNMLGRVAGEIYEGDPQSQPVRDRVLIGRNGEEQQIPISSIVGKVIFNTRTGVSVKKATAKEPVFGPVIEAVVYSDEPNKMAGIDLDSGRVVDFQYDPSATVTKDSLTGEKFFAANGVDAIGFGNSVWSINGLSCVNGTFAMPVEGSQWTNGTADWVLSHATNLPSISNIQMDKPEFQKLTVILWSEDQILPKSYIFKTGNGGMGILQITGFNQNPPGVKIRYKLVNTSSKPIAEKSEKFIGTLGSVIERDLPDPDNGSGKGNRETLNLRTGERSSILDDAPKEQGGRLRALVASKGDLFAEYDDYVAKRWALITADLRLADFPARQWDSATAQEIVEALKEPTVMSHVQHFGATLYLLPEDFVPLTLAFETREGARGLLQITKFESNPRSLNIRYKLLAKTSDTDAALKPIPPRAAELMKEIQTLYQSRFAPNASLDEKKFRTQLSALEKELESVLAGTAAEPLLKQQKEEMLKMQEATRAKDKAKIKEATERIQSIGSKLVELIDPDATVRGKPSQSRTGARAEPGQAAPAVPNSKVAAAIAGLDLAVEKIKQAAAKGELSQLADLFEYVNEACDQFQGKNQNAATTAQDWGIEKPDDFRKLMKIIGFLENDAEGMRSVARDRHSTKEERDALLQKVLVQFLERYEQFKNLLKASRKPNEATRETAVPRDYKLALTNGVTFEVVAICRNPRQTNLWWKPDGTPFEKPPYEIVELAKLGPTRGPNVTVNPTNEFLVFIRHQIPADWPKDVTFSFGLDWSPRPSDVEVPATIRDVASGKKFSAAFICFDEVPESVDFQTKVARGPWEPIAIYDGKQTKELVNGVMVVCSTPVVPEKRRDFQFEVMHNVDREAYDMRMMAKLKNGETREVEFHPGPVRGNPSKGFATIWPDELNPADVKEYALERARWERGEIKGIALKIGRSDGRASAVAPPEINSGTSEQKNEFSFSHREKLGEAVLDASRDFVEEHQWKLNGERGGIANGVSSVTIEAIDLNGKRVTFRDAQQADGMARFTLQVEPGSEFSAERIGKALARRLKLRAGWGDAMPEKEQAGDSSAAPEISAEQRKALVTEAQKTFSDFVKRDPKTRGTNIPPELWGAVTKSLKPVRVVDDRGNIKIVLEEGEIESGIYINLFISSFAPQAADFLEFTPLNQRDDENLGQIYRYILESGKASETGTESIKTPAPSFGIDLMEE